MHLNPDGTLHLDRATIVALGYDPDGGDDDEFEYLRQQAGLRREKTFLYLHTGRNDEMTHVEAHHYDRISNTCDISINHATHLHLTRDWLIEHHPEAVMDHWIDRGNKP